MESVCRLVVKTLVHAIFVFTFLLWVIYHITLRCSLCCVLALRSGCSYFSCVLKLLRVKASLYVGAAASKVLLSQDSTLIRRLPE